MIVVVSRNVRGPGPVPLEELRKVERGIRNPMLRRKGIERLVVVVPIHVIATANDPEDATRDGTTNDMGTRGLDKRVERGESGVTVDEENVAQGAKKDPPRKGDRSDRNARVRNRIGHVAADAPDVGDEAPVPVAIPARLHRPVDSPEEFGTMNPPPAIGNQPTQGRSELHLSCRWG